MNDVQSWLELTATFFVLLGLVPVVIGAHQYFSVGHSLFHTRLNQSEDYCPRTAILVPAWNEASVIGTTIEHLMRLHYPSDAVRVYVVDDASTDDTAAIVQEKARLYPGRVVHVYRENGGEGKAHTLNHGLRHLWKDDWAEAVLIMDADVIYTKHALRKMARHLASPEVGAVTAYIKEGSQKPNLIQRFIGFEYVTATGVSRRAQNVMGFLACLSGGAQLHSRQNLLDMGGEIYTDTLAEDTFTTFYTQLNGRKAIFEPNAIVYAEEPATLSMLWKQRLRWARGNVQITFAFKHIWARGRKKSGLGSVSMAAIWFSIFLMPIFQIAASTSLCVLYFIHAEWSWHLFTLFWNVAGAVYLIVTLVTLAIDFTQAKRTWFEGIMFPGVISLSIILFCFFAEGDLQSLPWFKHIGGLGADAFTLFLYLWLVLGMPCAYIAKRAEAFSPRLAGALLYISGYGAFLCAVTFTSYIKEAQGAERVWDKTEKTGTMGSL